MWAVQWSVSVRVWQSDVRDAQVEGVVFFLHLPAMKPDPPA